MKKTDIPVKPKAPSKSINEVLTSYKEAMVDLYADFKKQYFDKTGMDLSTDEFIKMVRIYKSYEDSEYNISYKLVFERKLTEEEYKKALVKYEQDVDKFNKAIEIEKIYNKKKAELNVIASEVRKHKKLLENSVLETK